MVLSFKFANFISMERLECCLEHKVFAEVPWGMPSQPRGKEYGPIQVVANCCPLLHVSLYV